MPGILRRRNRLRLRPKGAGAQAPEQARIIGISIGMIGMTTGTMIGAMIGAIGAHRHKRRPPA